MHANHLVKDEDFVKDAQRILAIGPDQFEELAVALEQFSSFLSRELLTEVVVEAIGETDDAKKIGRTIRRLATVLRESEDPVGENVGELKDAINEHLTQLNSDERQTLGERLDRLAAKPSGFDRQYKAQELVDATGKELDGLQFICDMRPVFNEDRSTVEGVIPLTTLRIDISDGDASSSMDIRLNEEQLNDLFDKSQIALRKLSMLKEFLPEKDITLPQTQATRRNSGGSE